MATSRQDELKAELKRREELQDELSKRQSEEGVLSSILPHLQNLGAGYLQGVKENLQSLPSMGQEVAPMGIPRAASPLTDLVNILKSFMSNNMAPELQQNIQMASKYNPFEMVQKPAQQEISKLDPYAMMGTTQQPVFNPKTYEPSLAGAEQKVGEYGPMILGAGKPIFNATRELTSPKYMAKKIYDYLGKGSINTEQNAKKLTREIREPYDRNVNRAINEKLNPVLAEGGNIELYPKIKPMERLQKQGGRVKVSTAKQDLKPYREIPDMPYKGNNKVQLAFDEFKKKPNVRNAQTLQSEIGNLIGDLRSQRMTSVERDILNEWSAYRNKLISRIDKVLRNKDPKLADRYQDFRTDWRENVEPFHATKKLRDITKGRATVVKNPHTIFESPANIETKEGKELMGRISKVISELPQSSRHKILFSKIGAEDKPKQLASKLALAEKRGYSAMFDPELKDMMNQLSRSEILKYFGIPKIGKFIKGFVGL